MTTLTRLGLTLGALLLALAPAASLAADVAHSTTGVGGYDLVSFHTGEKPVRGNGNHLVVHDGVTYLFQSEQTKAAFEANPERYLPAYGGFCAYGVAVGKKFHGDPDVWEVVDGRLYLNLDNKIKGIWAKDADGHIARADRQWTKIRNVPAASL